MNKQKDTIKKLQLDDLLDETDYIATDDEVKQAFKNRGFDQLPPTEVGGLFLSSVVKRLKADSLPKDSVL